MMTGYACLPMYDLPATRPLLEGLWLRVAGLLRADGLAPPAALDWGGDIFDGWLRGDLWLSQTCGLPFVRRLSGRVALVGAVDHGLPGIAPGMYCSRIIARRGEAMALEAFAGRRVAFNGPDSQSGAGALRHLVRPLLRGGRFFGSALQTGGHMESVRAVADGRADLAAIDAMTWELALRHVPEAQGLVVIASTEPTPGLPLITRAGGPVAALFAAIAAALEEMPVAERRAIGMMGIVPRAAADFDMLAQWDAEAAGYKELDG